MTMFGKRIKYEDDDIREMRSNDLMKGVKFIQDEKAIKKRKELEERKFQLELKRLEKDNG